MSQSSDRTLVLELLQPFRRALSAGVLPSEDGTGSAGSSGAPSSSVATKLQFDDTIINTGSSRNDLKVDSTITPGKRPRSESIGESIVDSPWQVKRFKLEALESRVQIEKLEKQLNHQHAVISEMEVLFNNERKMMTDKKKSKEAEVELIEQKLQSMRNREAELKNDVIKATRECNELKHKSEREKMALQKELYDVKNEMMILKAKTNEQVSGLKRELYEMGNELESTQKEAQEFKSIVEKAKADSDKLTDLQEAFDRQSIALQQAEVRLREFENSKKDLEEIKVLQKRLINMPSLEKEVVQLREETNDLRSAAKQNLLLEEKVQLYRNKVESLEPLYQSFCELQKSHIETGGELEEWRRMGDTYESPKPQAVINLIETLQQRELTFMSEKKDADVLLSTTKSELMNVKYEYQKTQSKLSDIQNIQKTQESFIHRLQKKLLLISRERDSYRQQLDCYEKELTMNIGDSQASHVGINSRVEGLERSLQGYKDLVAKLEEDIAGLRGTPAQQEQLTRLRDEVINLTKENEILRMHSDKIDMQLEQSVRVDNLNRIPGTKILHMVQNPLSKAHDDFQNVLKKANAEIAQLKRRIKLLEQNELEITQKLNETIQLHGPSTEEYNKLKEELESNKLKAQRVTEVYKASMNEFRDVCYTLLGYKIERIGTNYRFSSMYADSPNQYLCFKYSDGKVDMVQTDYSEAIAEFIDEHLHPQHYPMFLSELTMELFKKMTIISDSTIQ